jgi:hypothetical protein
MVIQHRTRRKAVGALVLLALTGGVASPASAQMPGYNGNNQSQRVWHQMDYCKRQAWKEHPDYTREGRVQRDASVKHCLEARNAPPVSPLTPRESQERSGSSR